MHALVESRVADGDPNLPADRRQETRVAFGERVAVIGEQRHHARDGFAIMNRRRDGGQIRGPVAARDPPHASLGQHGVGERLEPFEGPSPLDPAQKKK